MSREFERMQNLADHYVDILSDWRKIEKRPLFGAVALSRNGHVFAMIWRGSLYFKVDDKSQADYEAAKSHTLDYKSKGADRSLKSFWKVPDEVAEEADKLREWAERAHRAALESSLD